MADLFKPDNTLISKHFFLQPGRATFTQINQNTGETIGSVTGARAGVQEQQSQPDDGEHAASFIGRFFDLNAYQAAISIACMNEIPYLHSNKC